MNLVDQVCNLELAKKLKELGVNQESLYYWAENPQPNRSKDDWISRLVSGHEIDMECERGRFEALLFSAFTVAELGEMLPDLCLSGKVGKDKYNCWWFEEMCIREIKHYNTYQTDTEADAKARMLIYILKDEMTGGWTEEQRENFIASSKHLTDSVVLAYRCNNCEITLYGSGGHKFCPYCGKNISIQEIP